MRRNQHNPNQLPYNVPQQTDRHGHQSTATTTTFVPPRDSFFSQGSSTYGTSSTVYSQHQKDSSSLGYASAKNYFSTQLSEPPVDVRVVDIDPKLLKQNTKYAPSQQPKEPQSKRKSWLLLLGFLLLVAVAVAVLFASGAAASGSEASETTNSPSNAPVSTEALNPTVSPSLNPTVSPLVSPTPSPTVSPTPSPTVSPETESEFINLPNEVRGANDLVGVLFTESQVPRAAATAFLAARERWNTILAGSLGSVALGSIPAGTALCTDVSFNIDLNLNHLLLLVRFEDLGNGFQSNTGICARTNFPVVALNTISASALAGIEANGLLEPLALRNIGVALGIGVTWRTSIQGSMFETVGNFLLQNPVFDADGNVVQTETQPTFVGTNALQQFIGLGGSGSGVPVENGFRGGVAIFSPFTQAVGVADKNWDDEFLTRELMTFQVFSDSALSVVSLGSLRDVGYTVNLALADPYTLPNAAARNADPEKEPYAVSATVLYDVLELY